MTTEVLLIRHGSHGRLGHILCGRNPGVGLSDAGQAEAKSLAAGLRHQGRLDAILVSPLQRTRETAGPLAAAFGLEPTVDDDLNELDFGEWSGCAFESLQDQPAWQAWNLNRDHARPPGGETFAEAQMRAVRCLDRLCRLHSDGRVAIVSHGDLIKAALAWALGLPLAFYGRFEVSPASVSRISIGANGPKVMCINETIRP